MIADIEYLEQEFGSSLSLNQLEAIKGIITLKY